jgi:hypothetical protein
MTTPQWQRFAATAAARYGAPQDDYAELWRWSVDKPARFWRAVWDYFDVGGPGDTLADGEAAVLAGASMPGAQSPRMLVAGPSTPRQRGRRAGDHRTDAVHAGRLLE